MTINAVPILAALERFRVYEYDVFLVLEATVAYKEREGNEKPRPFREIPVEQRLVEISRED